MSVPMEHLKNHRKLEYDKNLYISEISLILLRRSSQSTSISIDDVKQKPFWEFREGRNFVCFW